MYILNVYTYTYAYIYTRMTKHKDSKRYVPILDLRGGGHVTRARRPVYCATRRGSRCRGSKPCRSCHGGRGPPRFARTTARLPPARCTAERAAGRGRARLQPLPRLLSGRVGIVMIEVTQCVRVTQISGSERSDLNNVTRRGTRSEPR